MNDRFRFRAWDKEEKDMVSYGPRNDKRFDYRDWCVRTDGFFGWVSNDGYIQNGEREFILMQCTGLKDKNGKFIYEGDILKYEYPAVTYVAPVYFGKYEQDGSGGEYGPTECLGFYVDLLHEEKGDWNKLSSLLEFHEDGGCEIIGNIHENPELLNDKKEKEETNT